MNSVSLGYARASEVINEEAEAIKKVASRLNESFDAAIDFILQSKGRLVLTGMGKHGLVARKIAATLASTGTSAFFMHPGEALHGDLGMLRPEDVVLALSNSGTTEEVVSCIPFFKRNGNVLIAMTGNLNSYLAKEADVILDIHVEREACPLNLAPTTSTTAALAMGDALAVVLLERRGFEKNDFALRHPNGALGRMFKRVVDLMKKDSNPIVGFDSTFREAVSVITAFKHGAVSIVDSDGRLAGILTDGDLRRVLQGEAENPGRTVGDVFSRPVSEVMTKNPMSVRPELLVSQTLGLMEDGPRKIMVLPVVDENHKPLGMIHMHDLIGG